MQHLRLAHRAALPMGGTMLNREAVALPLLLIALELITACRQRQECLRCETLVIAATGEPATLLPPLVGETVGRDVSDLIFERLAELRGGASPLDSAAYLPGLAERWE